MYVGNLLPDDHDPADRFAGQYLTQKLTQTFPAIVTFGIAIYKGDLLDQLETPLLQSVKMYQDNPKGSETDIKKKEAFKEVWNVIQRDVGFVIN